MSFVTRSDEITRRLPAWVPEQVRAYLDHTVGGVPIREVARRTGAHASTILRQIRRIETRRDDALIDAGLRNLSGSIELEAKSMGGKARSGLPDDATFRAESYRVLRRLAETGAVLAVASDMEKGVVVREGPMGGSQRTAVVDRSVAEALAVKGWIDVVTPGRITRYGLSAAGRAALETMAQDAGPGMSEAPAAFAGAEPAREGRKRMRYGLADSPLTALARRREKDGQPFLSDDLVSAGERLREDFELAQMGQRVAQDWSRFLDGGARSTAPGGGSGPDAAQARVATALRELGPGLSDVVLRCCCHLEGLETAEKKLGWSARSGKIVLRIALMRLKRHYDDVHGAGGGMIG